MCEFTGELTASRWLDQHGQVEIGVGQVWKAFDGLANRPLWQEADLIRRLMRERPVKAASAWRTRCSTIKDIAEHKLKCNNDQPFIILILSCSIILYDMNSLTHRLIRFICLLTYLACSAAFKNGSACT